MIQPDDQSIHISPSEEEVPIGIARIRAEWREAGLPDSTTTPTDAGAVEPVLFPEIDGGAGIGDYVLDADTVRDSLMLSQEAVDRLIDSSGLDSILVQGPDGVARRLISRSSFRRFQEDSAIDPQALKRVAKTMADQTVVESLDALRAEVEDMRGNQVKILQQMKDILLLEVRNLKEQDRDLASYVFELAEEIREALPKKKRK